MADIMKTRILEAAASLLKTVGQEGLTMEAAADLAGVSRKTIYNHFANRYALVDEAAAAWVDRTLSRLREIAEDQSLNMAARFKAVVERGFAEMHAGGRLMRRTEHVPGTGASMLARLEMGRRLRAFIEEILHEAHEAGYLKAEFEPRRLAGVILNVIEGLMLSDDPEDLSFSKIDILKDSLRAILGGVLSEIGSAALRDSPIFS